MAKELNEDTGFKVSIKSLIGIGFAMATLIGMWFTLQADIAEAKTLPEPAPPEITRMEFDMKDQLVRQTIMTTQEDDKEIKEISNKYGAKVIDRPEHLCNDVVPIVLQPIKQRDPMADDTSVEIKDPEPKVEEVTPVVTEPVKVPG